MIHTGRCKNCEKIKSAHYVPPNKTGIYCTDDNENLDSFEDSGIAALDAHKEELYEAVHEAFKLPMTAYRDDREMLNVSIPIMQADKIFSILNQIEKEK